MTAMWAVFDEKDRDLSAPLYWDAEYDCLTVRLIGAIFMRKQIALSVSRTRPGSRVVKIRLYQETPAPRRLQ